jgi:hypothetical protein
MRFSIALPIIFMIFILGCSNSSLITSADFSNQAIYSDTEPAKIMETSGSKTGLFGIYELSIDGSGFDVHFNPKRNVTLGQSYLISGLTFFTVSPCTDCFELKSLSLTPEGYLCVTFELKHPFQPGDPMKPPSGLNRLDLDIFDVELVIVPLNKTPDEFPLTGSSIFTKPCKNVDGYTIDLAELLQDDSAYPYYLVIDDSESAITTFNEFPMGANEEFKIELDISDQMFFDLYLTFGYGASATFGTRLYPIYYNPEFNRKNAWKVEVTPPNGDDPPGVGNTWIDNDSTTEYPVTVRVWDWQHGVTSVNNPPVNQGDIAALSDVAKVTVEIPGMTSSAGESTVPISGTGQDPDDPLVYEIQMSNENFLTAGEYTGLAKVTDERVPPSQGGEFEIDMLIDVPGPGVMVWYDIPEFTTYQTFTATVVTIPDCETQTTLAEGWRSDIQEDRLEVVRNQTDWENLWNAHNSSVVPPYVNFDTDMVVAVFLGGCSSSGYSATVDCVRFFPSYVDIEYTEHRPGPG